MIQNELFPFEQTETDERPISRNRRAYCDDESCLDFLAASFKTAQQLDITNSKSMDAFEKQYSSTDNADIHLVDNLIHCIEFHCNEKGREYLRNQCNPDHTAETCKCFNRYKNANYGDSGTVHLHMLDELERLVVHGDETDLIPVEHSHKFVSQCPDLKTFMNRAESLATLFWPSFPDELESGCDTDVLGIFSNEDFTFAEVEEISGINKAVWSAILRLIAISPGMFQNQLNQ